MKAWLDLRSRWPSTVNDTPPIPIYSDHERQLLAKIRENEERVTRLAITNKMLRAAIEDMKDLLRSYGHEV